MNETTAAIRKIYEDSLLEAESRVKFYRKLLGKPSVEGNVNCAKELKSLKSQLQKKNGENEVLHRKVHDLGHKLCQAHRECGKLRNELEAIKEELSVYRSKQDEVQAKAALYDEIVADASECWVGQTLMIKHEPTDYEPDMMFYFLRITKDEAFHIDMGGYAHLEVWED